MTRPDVMTAAGAVADDMYAEVREIGASHVLLAALGILTGVLRERLARPELAGYWLPALNLAGGYRRAVDWLALSGVLPDLPITVSQRSALSIACSLAAGTPVRLRDALGELDAADLAVVVGELAEVTA